MKVRQIVGMGVIPLFAFFCFTFSGCTNDGDSDTPPADTVVAQSDKTRNTSPDVPQEDISNLVDGNSAFAVDLYHYLKNESPDENRFFSPYSISMCFAMVYAGARNNTEAQMEDVFYYNLGADQLHPAINALSLDLASREMVDLSDGSAIFTLEIANSMWGQLDYEFLSPYLDLLAENYGAGIRLVDFKNEPFDSSEMINDWVYEKTEGLITDIIKPEDLNAYSLFVLVNAIYFKAKWKDAFLEDATQVDSFYTPEQTVTIPMMRQWCYVDYSEGENYQAAEIPYRGNVFGMLVLLPEPGSFEAFEASLTKEKIQQIVGDAESQEVVLNLPKFDCSPGQIDLKNVLSHMGMVDAFNFGVGDFSGMDGVPNWIYLHWARHKAFVTVNEEGTEAAAATGVGGGAGGYPTTPDIQFIVNRPFIFMIRDRVTNTILFMGRVLNPLA